MKNYTKVGALSGLLIFALNFCVAQTVTDSASVKKIMQPKSRVYARVELAFPIGAESGYDYPVTITSGFAPSVTVGYSFSKCFRLGGGAELLFTHTPYLPVFVSTEFGNHTKRVNASLNVNVGYAFLIPNRWIDAEQSSGAFAEFLPTISFGSYKTKSRFRISLGNQFVTATRQYYPVFELDQYSSNERFDNNVEKYRLIKMNMLLKVGMDF